MEWRLVVRVFHTPQFGVERLGVQRDELLLECLLFGEHQLVVGPEFGIREFVVVRLVGVTAFRSPQAMSNAGSFADRPRVP
jgi:hypothetical protein